MSNRNGQMALLTPGQMVDASMRKAFKVEDILNKKGVKVGEQMGMPDRATLAANFGLTTRKEHREQVELLVLEQTDSAMSRVIAANTTLPKMGFTLRKMRLQTLSNGDEQLTQVFRRSNAKSKGPTDEAIAKAWNIPIEQVAAFKADAIAKAKASEVEIESVVSGQNTANEMTDEELERQTAPAVK